MPVTGHRLLNRRVKPWLRKTSVLLSISSYFGWRWRRSSILTEGLRPKGSSHPLSLTRPLLIKEESYRTSLRSSGQFSHLVLRVCEERKLKNPKISLVRCPARHTNPGNCPRQFHGNKGGTTPENLFPAAPRAAFKNSLTWKILKGWKKTSKEFTNRFYFERKKDHRKRGPVTKMSDICPRGQSHRDESFDFRLTKKLRTSIKSYGML